MEKEFIPYEQALALKELGFDEPCLGWFDVIDFELFIEENEYSESNKDIVVLAPLYQQAFRWFRKKSVLISWIDENNESFRYNIQFGIGGSILGLQGFISYEEAELECLKKLIELCKNN